MITATGLSTALLGWSTNAQTTALGVALLLAVLLDQTSRRLRRGGA